MIEYLCTDMVQRSRRVIQGFPISVPSSSRHFASSSCTQSPFQARQDISPAHPAPSLRTKLVKTFRQLILYYDFQDSVLFVARLNVYFHNSLKEIKLV
ncbi:hypothetical protein BgiMline_003121 [Biomphalaria glabrata]|nr:hypothetical protein BgiMline_011695 [Biomphalaria glabrata]KAI8793124.1 hypothetical protein BgiBS90_006113 [Biomphalaria glabrata]